MGHTHPLTNCMPSIYGYAIESQWTWHLNMVAVNMLERVFPTTNRLLVLQNVQYMCTFIGFCISYMHAVNYSACSYIERLLLNLL